MLSYRKKSWRQHQLQSSREFRPSLIDMVFKYLGYWPLFLGLLIFFGTAAWLYVKVKVPIYETTATILINDEKKGTDGSKVLESLNAFNSKKIVENEIEVLKSKALITAVAKNLHLYATISAEDRFINPSAYLTSPIRIIAENPQFIKPVKKQYFQFDPNGQQVILNGKKYPLQKWVVTDFGTLKFISNAQYVKPSNPRPLFFSLQPVKEVVSSIAHRLSVMATNKLSTVISLQLRDEVPQRGEDILNELVSVYNQAAINDKNKQAANTLAFVEERLKYIVQDLDSIEHKMQRFKTTNNVVDISTQGRMFLENVGANDQKIGDISMQLAMLNQIEDYVLGKGEKGGIVPSTLGIDDPLLPGLLEKLYNAELELEKTSKIAPDNNPIQVALADQIQKIKPSILENIQNQRRSLLAGKNDLNLTNSKYISLLQNIPVKERELLEISRQQAIKNNIYTYLLQKREEAALSYASTVGDNRLVDKADSSGVPVSPKKLLIYLSAFFGAMAVGFVFVKLKELLNTKIESRDEVESYTRIPVFSEVTQFDLKSLRFVKEDNQHPMAEQFRHMRTSLSYLGIDEKRKKILITSSIAEEGKSFIAANLGLSLALLNKKVVLLEFDLRKPKLAQAFNIQGLAGITEYLHGLKQADEIIHPTEVCQFFFISNGCTPSSPSDLLMGDKVKQLFAYLEDTFDYIIVDSPPVNPVTDAYLLSPLCDATLFVVRQGVTPRILIQELDERFQTKGLNNPAIIFNGMKKSGFRKYQYGYSYYNHYMNSGRKTRPNKEIPRLFS